MKINQIKLRQIHIPLNFTFSQSNNAASTTSNSVIIELISDDGITGVGEACPRLYVTGEDYDSVAKDLANCYEVLYSSDLSDFEEFLAVLNKLNIGSSTACALELAWLDLWSKTSQRSLPELLHLDLPESLRYSLVLPLASIDTFKKLLQRVKIFKPPSIKIKVDKSIDLHIQKIRLLRSNWNYELPIRLDINGGWTLAEAMSMIPIYLSVGVRSFEQPLDPKDLDGAQMLTAEFGKDALIMADESLLNLKQATYYLNNKSFNHFNLKISKLGGISKAKAIYELAKSHQVGCQIGAHFGETSILSAAGLLLSGMTAGFSNLEGALGNILLQKDITSNVIQQNLEGFIYPNQYFDNQGLTNQLDLSLLESYTSNKRIWKIN